MEDKPRPEIQAGIYPTEVIRDVAESVGITGLTDTVATGLAGDVEYRITLLIEEASKFMKHSKRTALLPCDIENALKVLNIEPLYSPHPATSIPTYRRVATPAGPVFALEDKEIDFEKALREPLPRLSKGPSYTSHWLAIEGVQPLIPQNPAPTDNGPMHQLAPAQAALNNNNNNGAGVGGTASTTIHPPVKHLLSHELQLYYIRLTSALLSPATNVPEAREAALASLRGDPGLGGLVPYLVRFAAEKVSTNLSNLDIIDAMVGVVHSLIDNQTLFIEPYLHQILPLLLTTLLTSSYPAPPDQKALWLRQKSASLIARLLNDYSNSYPTLSGRVAKTLFKALSGDDQVLGESASTDIGTRFGSVLGLKAIGKNTAVRALIHEKGLRGLSELAESLNDEAKMQMIDVVIEVLAEVLPEAKAVEINSSQIEDTCGSLIASQIPVKKPELTSSIATALQEESGAEETV
ncbi:TAF-domain-containing protein [Wallemia mellicola]|nr:TAF-domain-containing protein [Wallemia mellicola]